MPRTASELSPIVEEEDEAAFRDRVWASLRMHQDDIAELHELVYMTVQAATQQWEALTWLCAEFEAVKPSTDSLEKRVSELRTEVCAVRGVLGHTCESVPETPAPEDGVTETPQHLPRRCVLCPHLGSALTQSGENLANAGPDDRNLEAKTPWKFLEMDSLTERLRDRVVEEAPVDTPRDVGSLFRALRLDPIGFDEKQRQFDLEKLNVDDSWKDLPQGSMLGDISLGPTVSDKGLRPFNLKKVNTKTVVPFEDNSWKNLPQGAPVESRRADILPNVEKKFGSFHRKQPKFVFDVVPPEDGVNGFMEGALMESRRADPLPNVEKKFGSFHRKQPKSAFDVVPPEDGVTDFMEGSLFLSFERPTKLGSICLKEVKPQTRAANSEEGLRHEEIVKDGNIARPGKPDNDQDDEELDDLELDRLMEQAPIAVEGVTAHPRKVATWRSPDSKLDPDADEAVGDETESVEFVHTQLWDEEEHQL
jgi:hypothetical protein